jgi:hypothetical protein
MSIIATSRPQIDKLVKEALPRVKNNPDELKMFLTQTLLFTGMLFSEDIPVTPTTEMAYRIAKKIKHLGDVTYFLTKMMYEYAKNNGRGGEYNWANLAHVFGILDVVYRQVLGFIEPNWTDLAIERVEWKVALPASVVDDLAGSVCQAKLEVYSY